MGKKVKVGKARKDKYYQLAKETGYRSRAAFKLLQLNRKFEFLQRSNTCIDLCAAPGGWLQVAQRYMPLSSLIIGVDLVPIKQQGLEGVVLLQEDITTEKCRQSIKPYLRDRKADLVLHDGAPNVGKNWIHDAYQQADLTLQALKLATVFLEKGGYFVTKIFRSKDYFALLWVFQQMFKKVHATKPQASRNESAEIFVVCQNYKAPDHIDPKFLDFRHVFKDLADTLKPSLNLVHPEKLNKKADGYADGDFTMEHKITATQFALAENFLELLKDSTEILLDDERLANHPLTTAEIKECLKDIKVLGKKDLRNLLNWQKAMKKFLQSLEPKKETEEEEMETAKEDTTSDHEEEELRKQEEEIVEKQEEIQKDLKKKRKKTMKEKRKLRDKMNLNMVIPGDVIDAGDEIELFSLKAVKTKKDLDEVEEKVDVVDDIKDADASDDEPPAKYRKVTMTYDRHGDDDESEAASEEEDESKMEDASEDEDGNDDGDSIIEEEENPLLVNLNSKKNLNKLKTSMWFSKDAFAGIADEEADDDDDDDDDDEDEKDDVADVAEVEKDGQLGDTVKKDSAPKIVDAKKTVAFADDVDSDSDSDDDDDDDDSDDDDDVDINAGSSGIEKNKANSKNLGFEIVSNKTASKKVIKLTPAELAVGEELIKSKKRRREIVELNYNRFTHGEENLPDWFQADEVRHSKKQLPVTKDQIQYYKDRQKTIDANPIKKVAEAQARKKHKMTKRLEKARKKAENLTDDMPEKEKMKQTKEIYKKYGLLKGQKKELTYVVAKKGVGKRVARPAGVKGHYRVVDPRMKKDNKHKKMEQKSSKKGKGFKGRKQQGKGKGRKSR